MPLCRRSSPAVVGLLLLLAACSKDGGPTLPQDDPGPGPDLGRAAFQLTIDVASGKILVARPAASRGAGSNEAVSFSLIGGEAVEVHATDCTWSAVPRSTTRKRCTFDLALQNRLGITDLTAPTTFPKAPPGTAGVLVFPFSAAALGVPGGTAVPTTDWDNAPANLFNDFAGCSGKTSDCYRSETFPTLYAGETSEPRTVGFEVDKNAHTVSVYIVVAADLRDNPLQETTLTGNAALCGGVEKNFLNGTFVPFAGALILVGPRDGGQTGRVVHGFCGFDLPEIVVDQAILRVFQEAVSSDPYAAGDVITVDQVDFGSALDDADYDLAPIRADIGTLSNNTTIEWKTLDVTEAVQDDLANLRSAARFRFQFRDEDGQGSARFTGLNDLDGNPTANPPELWVRYRLK